MTFQNFDLSKELLRAIEAQGYTEPTPIQAQAIPLILAGKDLMAGAQTGTGKTAGFTLPLLQNLMKNKRAKPVPRALILTPTRELAAQVEESVKTYGKFLPLKSTVVYGGMSINSQIAKLRHGVDIIVATPGRLLDLVNQRAVNLSQIEILVLDEGDRMLDMGFIHDIRKIIALLPKQRQNLLFSATYSNEIKKLADGLLQSPVVIQVANEHTTPTKVTEEVYPVDSRRKCELLTHLIQTSATRQVLVFTRTKHGANRLTDQLETNKISATAIHGNKTQGARARALAEFKRGAVQVLVATDVAARGIDIDQLPLVVNFDLPNVPEDYVHRIGRTGRAGNEGKAISLVCIDEHKLLRDIERLLRRDIPKVHLPHFKPDPSIRAQPILCGRGRGQGRRPSNNNGPRSNERSGPRRHSAKPRFSR